MKKIILLLALTAILHNMQGQNPSAAKPVKKTVGATSSNINATTTSTLSGIFYAPSGISIVLQNNGKNDLTISPKKKVEEHFQ